MTPFSQPVSPTPTVLATILATSILSGAVGYYLGLGSTLLLSRDTPSSSSSSTKPTSTTTSSSSYSSATESESDTPTSTSNIQSFSDVNGECKLVLIVRTDLPMTKGKTAAQCSHATLACYKSLQRSSPSLLRRWEQAGQAKIALRGNDEEELITLQAQAQSLGITARIIHDAGRTQIAAVSFAQLLMMMVMMMRLRAAIG
ncbi:PTH2-domain-containing protein [Terfezia boudieri ATCC MYA-4762]|uniref:peptidyl-tRNA hydrolase n=1 Tax=Terfezia boudieri ATCC MYA-4762 TaxID=1051890 RepID=A0A3N4M5H3_9PEZI|nr:PTH2-domain-containing protein [Terfezia boudieri ATCC MYA-4762]